MLEGHITTQDSWFPGYGWTIMYCSCFSHLGWKFTAVASTDVNEDEDTVYNSQEFFWGIRRGALTERINGPIRRPRDSSTTGILVHIENFSQNDDNYDDDDDDDNDNDDNDDNDDDDDDDDNGNGDNGNGDNDFNDNDDNNDDNGDNNNNDDA